MRGLSRRARSALPSGVRHYGADGRVLRLQDTIFVVAIAEEYPIRRSSYLNPMLLERIFLRLALTWLCLCATALTAQTTALPSKENFHLFLLVGQSNMAGRGVVSPSDTTPHARVLMLNKSGEWVPAVDPMHFDKPAAVGVGLGRTFGITVAEATPGVTIGLIPCAVGGSPIDAWQPGVLYPPTKSHPWDDALRRAQVALRSGTLKGILWHQGESDSKAELAPKYREKLYGLIARLRSGLRAPEVPFIVGQLGQFADSPWSEFRQQVDQVHQALPQNVRHTAFVSSGGLKHKGDKVHFDAESYRELGRRYAKAYLELIGK